MEVVDQIGIDIDTNNKILFNNKMPMKEKQFYCVSCRARKTAHAGDMGVTTIRNKKVQGGVVALKAECPHCPTNLTKFVPRDKKASLMKEYGKW